MIKNEVLVEGIKKIAARRAQTIAVAILAACIPVLLLLSGVQARRFAEREREVEKIESMQYEVIEANKRLVTGISILSNPQRIENLAADQLNLREAGTDEIVRVKLKGE